MRYFGITAVGLCLLATLISTGFAPAGENAAPEGEMDPQMAAWLKMASPGEHHQHLAELAGDWKFKNTFWTHPGAEPMISEGTAHSAMILGGRYLQSNFTGELMGQPFLGLGFDGYDNIQQKHVGLWMDTAGTMMLQLKGECTDGGKVVTMNSEFLNPMGEMETMKAVTTVVSKNEYRWEAWQKGPEGEPFKSMEIVYTRR